MSLRSTGNIRLVRFADAASFCISGLLCCAVPLLCLHSAQADSTQASSMDPSVRAAVNWNRVNPQQALLEVQKDENLWTDKHNLLESIDHSLSYLDSAKASEDYNKLKNISVSREEVIKSVSAFRKLVKESSDYQSFSKALEQNFELIKPQSGSKTSVKFTGYFQPTYNASRTKTEKFRYPIYKQPEDFSTWPKPHPKRIFLEGYEGQGNKFSPLYGNEIAYLATRWEAFMIHVQGSAILSMENGEQLAVGFAAATDYHFKGVSKSFMQQYNVAWNNLPGFFTRNPELLNQVLIKNNRYIFFQENPDSNPIGSLGVPVIAERSIATDKSLMPPGALSVVSALLPYVNQNGDVRTKNSLRFVLDQDTGSAIKGTNRVDIFMGSGSLGQKKANAVYSQGEMYYLLLKSSS